MHLSVESMHLSVFLRISSVAAYLSLSIVLYHRSDNVFDLFLWMWGGVPWVGKWSGKYWVFRVQPQKNRYDSMQSHNKWFGWMDGWLNGFLCSRGSNNNTSIISKTSSCCSWSFINCFEVLKLWPNYRPKCTHTTINHNYCGNDMKGKNKK